MPSKITTCLWFDTEGEEAAAFYCSVIPNSRVLDVSRYGEATPDRSGTAMTVSFELDGKPYVALNGGPQYTFNEAVSLQVSCEDQDEVAHYWEVLSEGGVEGPCGGRTGRGGGGAGGGGRGRCRASPGSPPPPCCRSCSAPRTPAGPNGPWRR